MAQRQYRGGLELRCDEGDSLFLYPVIGDSV